MKRNFLRVWLWVGIAWVQAVSLAGEPTASKGYNPSAQTAAVEIVRYEWLDPKRDRKVPVKIYFPKTDKGSLPVIIFSHGLGGSREGYEYLGRHWAANGYVSLHLQHLGSDDAVWRDVPPAEMRANLGKSAASLRNAINRPLDVIFAIDQLERLNKEPGPLKGRLDLERIGVAGHSFGAFTTLAIAGQTFASSTSSLADPRVKAAIAMSAPVPALKSRRQEAFSSIRIPIFHMTGTRDDSPIGETKAADRRVPYDNIAGADQFLLTFDGGDHMVFSGRGTLRRDEKDKVFQQLILSGSLAFWDAYLKADPAARRWLVEGGFEKELGAEGKFEQKLKR